VAMGEARTKESGRQLAMVCLDELVPEDDRYRRIDALVGDWGFVREAARSYYSEGIGRPSVDPTVLLKLMLAGALEGIGSMRELLRVAGLRLDLRLFLGYGLGERLPAHQTISEAQTQRFADGEVFERLFLRTVALCKEHDLLDGSHLSVDGFHVEANAALGSLRASLESLAGDAAHEPEADGIPAPAWPQLRLAEPRSGPTPKRKASNATAVSTTDPDARLKGKPGQRPHLVHRGHVAVDPQARCIVSCLGERAEGHEGDGLAPILDRARFVLPRLASVGADQGYAAERVWEDATQRGIVAYIPPQKTMLPKREPRTNAQRLALEARARMKSEHGLWAYRRRMADAEGVIAELKTLHAFDRVRCRGTPAFHVQLLVGSAALNLKRLAKHAPAAHEGVAAAPAAAAAAHNTGSDQPQRNHLRATNGIDRKQLVWTVSLCLN
jgi:transposase